MLALALLLTPISAANPFAIPGEGWPRWRGPNGDNVSIEIGWSASPAPEPLWRAAIGLGYSTPLVVPGTGGAPSRVFACGYFEGEEDPRRGVDRVVCLDAETGAELWSHEYPTEKYDFEHGGGTIGTGLVHEGVFFVPTRAGQLRAYDAENGELRWEADLRARHELDPGRYGFAGSPIAFGDDVVVNMGRVLRIDRATGETVWTSEDYTAGYSTPAPLWLEDELHLVVFGHAGVAVIEAARGDERFLWPFRKGERNVEGATPIVMGTRVLVSSAYDQGGALVEFGGDEPVELWRSRHMRTKMAGATLFEGHLYGFDESMLKCVDLEGEERWRKRGLGQGALSIAGGRILTTTSEGELVVAEASPEGYRELARTSVVEGGVFWTAPVLADGRVFFRGSRGELVCLDHRTDAGGSAAAAEGASVTTAMAGPESLARRHLTAMGLAERQLPGVRQSGTLNNDALGLAGVACDWDTGPGGLWHMRFALPPGMPGEVHRTFDGELGWANSPRGDQEPIEGPELTELRRTRGRRTLFDPLHGGEARSVGPESFRGVLCKRVDVQVTETVARSLYFDSSTGYLRGHTAPDESTVVYADWREVDGVRLPFSLTQFDLELGQEWRFRFDEAHIESLPVEMFEVPEAVLEVLAGQ